MPAGKNEKTADKNHAYSRRDARVLVAHLSHGGQSRARNKGLGISGFRAAAETTKEQREANPVKKGERDMVKKQANALDPIRVVLCAMVAAAHCHPVFGIDILDFYADEWLFRFTLPFFFFVTGYYFSQMDRARRRTYIRRIALMYVFAEVLYLPPMLRQSTSQVIRSLLHGYYHLWYINTLLIGLILFQILDRLLHRRKSVFILLLAAGALLNIYCQASDPSAANKAQRFVQFIEGGRNGLFYALPMLLIGELLSRNNHYVRRKLLAAAFVLSFVPGFVEITLLKNRFGMGFLTSANFTMWLPAVPLFLLGIETVTGLDAKLSRQIRKTADDVYIIHIWVLYSVDKFFHPVLWRRYFAVIICSFAAAGLYEWLKGKWKSSHWNPSCAPEEIMR